MNILVIGNGFDLAHGLPTKYGDFLKFVEVIRQVLNTKGEEIDWKDIHLEIKELIKINMENVRNNIFSQEQIWRELLEENFWIEYFLQYPMYQKENWIDFESEISNVIQSIDFDMKNNNLKLDDDDSIVSNFYIEKFFHKRLPAAVLDFGEDIQVITFREMRDVLYQDLNKLTRAFEIYLCEYVGKIESVKISKEIKSLGIDHVLSFNYSHAG